MNAVIYLKQSNSQKPIKESYRMKTTITEELFFESNITYSNYTENAVTAGVWIGEGINNVLEARGGNKMEAANALYKKFKAGNYSLF